MSWKEKFRMVVSVYLLLKDDEGRILLLKRQNTGYKDGEYGLPAGHVDGNEPLEVAMCREAKEEIGLDLDPEAMQFAHIMHRHCNDHERLDAFFICEDWSGEPTNTEPDKCSELRWCALDALPENIIDYYARAFTFIQHGVPYSSFGWKEGESYE